MKDTKRIPKIALGDDNFGAVLNCAVRYCIGRRTYMPTLVMDFIRPLLPYLTERTLYVMEEDIERAESYGDPNIDEPEWKRFLKEIKKVRENAEQ